MVCGCFPALKRSIGKYAGGAAKISPHTSYLTWIKDLKERVEKCVSMHIDSTSFAYGAIDEHPRKKSLNPPTGTESKMVSTHDVFDCYYI